MLHQPLTAELQRTRGEARVALARRRGRARLADLFQAGAAKALLPRVEGEEPEVVFLNTAGGLTGGDWLAYGLALGPGVRATATTQAAERAYAAAGGRASVWLRLEAAAGARLDWLPQETILFQGAALDRLTEVELAADAACLLVETIVLGRAAMGERVTSLALRDSRRILRAGRPVHVEALALDGAALAHPGAAVLGGARAFASLVLVAPGAEDALGPVRQALGAPGAVAAASAWDGRCVVRIAGGDAWPVRRQTARVLAALRGGRPLPRVWQP